MLICRHAEGIDEVAEVVLEEEIAVLIEVSKIVLSEALLTDEDEGVVESGGEVVNFEYGVAEAVGDCMGEDHDGRGLLDVRGIARRLCRHIHI